MDGFNKFLQVSDAIDVMIFKENGESITLPAFVYDVIDDEKMIISHPLHQGGLYPLSRNSEYYFRFFIENNGMFLFKGTIFGRMNFDNLPSVVISLASEIKKVQRRKFFRVHFHSEGYFSFRKVLSDEEIEAKRKVLEKKFKNSKDIVIDEIEEEKVKFQSLDISGGGMKILTNRIFENGEILEGAFKIASVWVDFKGEVTRVVLKDSKAYEISLKFVELDSATQSKIVSYVFEAERNLIKKGLM